MASARYRWPCLVAALFAALMAAPASAAPKSIFTKAQTTFKDPAGSRSVYGEYIAKTDFPTSSNLPSVYNKATLPVSARTLTKAVKFGLGGPIGAALTAAAIYDDLVARYNESTDTWELVHPPEVPELCPGNTLDCGHKYSLGLGASGSYECLIDYGTTIVRTGLAPIPPSTPASDAIPSGSQLYNSCGTHALYRFPSVVNYDPVPMPATEQEYFDAMYDHLTLEVWQQMLDEFIRTRQSEYMNDQLSELKQALDQIANAHQQALDNNLTLDTDIEIVYDSTTNNLNDYSTDLKQIQNLLNQVVSNTSNITINMDGATLEIPTDCDFHPTICAFIDWFKTTEPLPEHPDLPVEDIGPETFNSGLGSGSCPAPVQFSFQGRSMEYSYDTACDVAVDIFRPIVIMLANVIAAFVILGVRNK